MLSPSTAQVPLHLPPCLPRGRHLLHGAPPQLTRRRTRVWPWARARARARARRALEIHMRMLAGQQEGNHDGEGYFHLVLLSEEGVSRPLFRYSPPLRRPIPNRMVCKTDPNPNPSYGI